MSLDKRKFITWLKNYTDYAELEQEAKNAFHGYDIKDPQIFFSKLKDVIYFSEKIIDIVEKFSRDVDSLSSRDKLDAAVEGIDDLIKLNFFMEWFDGIAIKLILSTIVNQKNKWFGKDWFKIDDEQ